MATYFFIYSVPALAKNWAFRGLSCFPWVSSIILVPKPMGLGRSSQTDLMLPGFMVSKPTTMAQSMTPPLTKVRASWRPVEPVAQALLVL